MKLKNKPSDNFEDHTGRSKVGKLLDILFTSLNPVYAYRNVMANGPTRQKLEIDKVKPSKNFVDKTNLVTNPNYSGFEGGDWKSDVFWQAMRRFHEDGVRADGSLTLKDPRKYRKPLVLR